MSVQQAMDEQVRAELRRAVLNVVVTRNRSCHENTGCKTFEVRPIQLDDEADAVVDAVLRTLKRHGMIGDGR